MNILRTLSFFLTLLFFFPSDAGSSRSSRNNHPKYTYEVAIVAIFNNEARFLREWIEYHKLLGVKRFYLYNHNSQDNFMEVLRPYLAKREVVLIHWRDIPSNLPTHLERWNKTQCLAYKHAVFHALKDKVKWLAVIDIDEFIVPMETDDLGALLNGYAKYAGLGVNWQLFGTSYVEKIPENSLLIEQLNRRAEKDYEHNNHVKTILQPRYVADCYNPHFFVYKPGYYNVDENGEYFDGATTKKISVNKIAIYHYWSRDIHFLIEEKGKRQKEWGNIVPDLLKSIEPLNEEYDPDSPISRFIPRLKNAVFIQ